MIINARRLVNFGQALHAFAMKIQSRYNAPHGKIGVGQTYTHNKRKVIFHWAHHWT